jgi:hypothetical protein
MNNDKFDEIKKEYLDRVDREQFQAPEEVWDFIEEELAKVREEVFKDFMKWREKKLYEWLGKTEVEVLMNDYENMFDEYLSKPTNSTEERNKQDE